LLLCLSSDKNKKAREVNSSSVSINGASIRGRGSEVKNWILLMRIFGRREGGHGPHWWGMMILMTMRIELFFLHGLAGMMI
jgi:hypothetical protein